MTTNNFNLYGCRKCFQKYKLTDLSNIMQLCQNCVNTSNSTTYKQCFYCNSDFKNNIAGDKCPKCLIQLDKHGEPSQCTICKMKMVFGNAVICIRCSHYRSKFGEPRQCENCCQHSAFVKDSISRQKVNGKVLCWLCTYFYKLQKSKVFKANKDKNTDIFSNKLTELSKTIDKNIEFGGMSRNDSTNSLLSAEPISKRSRIDEDNSLSMYSNDTVYNEQLLKVNSLQEEIKVLRRKVATKDTELLAKDNLIAGLKADMLQKEKDVMNREIVMKSRWDNERENLMEKIRNLQRENINIVKSGKKKRPTPSGLQYLTKNPLLVLPASITDSPEVNRGGSVSKDVSSAEDSPH